MQPNLFKTPDELEAYIRRLPCPDSFGEKKKEEMIKLGREAFQIRNVIAKNLVGNSKGFDKYAAFIGEFITNANQRHFGEEINSLKNRLEVLEDGASKFDGFLSKIAMAMAEQQTSNSLKKAKVASLESIITGYGVVIEGLLKEAQVVADQVKRIQGLAEGKQAKFKLLEAVERNKLNQEKREKIKRDIEIVQQENLEKSTKTLVAIEADLKDMAKKLGQLFGLVQKPEEMVKNLRRYCTLQVEFNNAFGR